MAGSAHEAGPPRGTGAANGSRPADEAGRQLSIFGAESSDASPFDLVGLLLGPGRLVRMGNTARVSVPVDAAWRVHVLVAELVTRGLVVTWRPLPGEKKQPGERPGVDDARPEATPGVDARPGMDARSETARGVGARPGAARGVHDARPGAAPDEDELPEIAPDDDSPASRPIGGGASAVVESVVEEPAERSVPASTPTPGDEEDEQGDHRNVAGGSPVVLLYEVLTAYSSRLNALARAWPAASDQLFLSGPRLRLWVAAAGRRVEGGYALGLGAPETGTDNPDYPRIGVDAALRRAGLDGVVSDLGRHYLISGRKPLQRLAELVGERPAAAPEDLWPGGASA